MNTPLEYLIEAEDAELRFGKILGTLEKGRAEMVKLWEVVAPYPSEARHRWLLSYARGYQDWLLAGLPILPVEQLRSIGNEAPEPSDAFRQQIEDKRTFDAASLSAQLQLPPPARRPRQE